MSDPKGFDSAGFISYILSGDLMHLSYRRSGVLKKHVVCGLLLAGMTVFPGAIFADHLTIPAGAFKAGDGSTVPTVSYYGEYVSWAGPSSGWLYAQVHLPSGVYVKNIRTFYYDNTVTGRIVVYFSRMNHWTADSVLRTQEDVFHISSGDSTASHLVEYQVDSTHDTVAAHRLIQNNNCTYWVAVWFGVPGDDLRLYNVQIEYN